MQQIKTGILFQDGCVLQRDKEIPVWGEGPEGAEVTVVLEESRAVSRVKDGKWKCVLPPRKAARGLTMTVTCDGETIKIQTFQSGRYGLPAASPIWNISSAMTLTGKQ